MGRFDGQISGSRYVRKDLARNVPRSSRSGKNANEKGIYLRTLRFFSLPTLGNKRQEKRGPRYRAALPLPTSFSFPWPNLIWSAVQLHLSTRLTGTRGYEAPEDHRKNACVPCNIPAGSEARELGILLTRIVAFNFKPETIRVITVSISCVY